MKSNKNNTSLPKVGASNTGNINDAISQIMMDVAVGVSKLQVTTSSGSANAGSYSAGVGKVGVSNAGGYSAGYLNASNHSVGGYNAGFCNTGRGNTGYRSTGGCNTGDYNVGGYNVGDFNVGSCNAGKFNVGNQNAGGYNTGLCNVGSWNVGSYNFGDYNAGDYNTGSHNVGYCNTITPDDAFIFNKPGKRSDWLAATKPKWMSARLTRWVDVVEMSDKEKQAYPTYTTTGGYLKVYTSLQHAYIDSWEKSSKEDRELTYKLPNFDPEVFQEIFGFNPCECVEEKRDCAPVNADVVEINGIKYKKID